MKPCLLVVGFAALTLWGADAASAFVSANTIDGQATYTRDGARVRATGPIGYTSGERVSMAKTRIAGRVTDTRKWCERVAVSARF